MTIRPLVFDGAVSAMYTGTVTEAPPGLKEKFNKNKKNQKPKIHSSFRSYVNFNFNLFESYLH